MVNSMRIWLVVAALLAALLMAACGGGDGDNGDADGDEPTATVPAGDEDTDEGDATATEEVEGDEGGDGNGGGEAFGDIPIPSGADETGSGSFTSSDIPFFVPGDEVDPEAFSNIEYREYETDASPEEVMDFYRDELGDWDEVFVFSGGDAEDEGGFGVWTRDGGRAVVWIGVSTLDGATDLIVIVGAQE